MEPQEAQLENCDVHDRECLAVYRYHRRRWIEMLNGNDIHAVSAQLTDLLDTELNFRMVLAARDICSASSVPQNGTIHWLIDYGFISHQVLAIRRLTEAYNGARNREVFSLRRVLDEIDEHRDLITREVYVCNWGYAFAPQIDDLCARHLHELFDELSCTSESARSRTDLIHADVFTDLRKLLESSNAVRHFCNKLLAHAAAPSNRGEPVAPALSSLRDSYRSLIRVARTLSARILWSDSRDFLPAYLCNPLQHLDSPLCPPSGLDELAAKWRDQHRELRDVDRSPSSLK